MSLNSSPDSIDPCHVLLTRSTSAKFEFCCRRLFPPHFRIERVSKGPKEKKSPRHSFLSPLSLQLVFPFFFDPSLDRFFFFLVLFYKLKSLTYFFKIVRFLWVCIDFSLPRSKKLKRWRRPKRIRHSALELPSISGLWSPRSSSWGVQIALPLFLENRRYSFLSWIV